MRRLLLALPLLVFSCKCEAPVEPPPPPPPPPPVGDAGSIVDGGAPVVDAGPLGPQAPFVYASGCRFPPEPPGASGYEVVNAFPNQASFGATTFLTHAGDGSDRLFVVGRAGVVSVMPNDPTGSARSTFLDVSGAVDGQSEGGLHAIAFHPDYAENGELYLSYTTSVGGGGFRSRLSRMLRDSADPDAADEATEEVLLEVAQPFGNHNGGMLAFGPDGYLYWSLGDGGSSGDPEINGQDTQTLLGAILRLDVDVAQAPLAYGIPTDNPFASDPSGGRPEIYAWGFRNPWRFSFDRLTGELWVGDVGQGRREEVDVVERGRNYGWRLMEGFRCFNPQNGCDDEGVLARPEFDYPRSVGESITGGYIYRGAATPSLYGAYIFADFDLNNVFIYRPGEGPFDSTPVDTLTNVASLGEDQGGEVYLVQLGGTLFKLAEVLPPASDAGPVAQLPARLSDTGCFDDVAGLIPSTGVVPYELNQAFWSDGAEKRRWFVLPEGGKITYSAQGKWRFPVGTIFIKHFEFQTNANDPASKDRLETRFLITEEAGVRGYTYRWNGEQTDAVLTEVGESEDFVLANQPDSVVNLTWQYPGRNQCLACHTSGAGLNGALGLETAQLERSAVLDGLNINQLDAYKIWDLFDGPVEGARDSFPALDDEGASLEARARAYLHINCTSCHVAGGVTGTDLDLRYTTALADMEACNLAPQKGNLGVANASLLKPGSAAESVIYLRTLQEVASRRMPPLATDRFDRVGTEVLERWINSLTGCE